MAGLLIDARARFTVARCAAIAKRQMDGLDIPVDVEFLEAQLRDAMRSGHGFDMDGRIVDP